METIRNIIAYIIYYLIKYIMPTMFLLGISTTILLYSFTGYNWNFLEIF